MLNQRSECAESWWIAAALAIVLATPATAQPCFVPSHYEILEPAEVTWTDNFGQSMASDGEWLFVGAPMDDEVETDAGAVYVFRLIDMKWVMHQKLVATGGVGPAQFGISAAIDGETALIGAHRDREFNPDNAGAAYIFRLVGEMWSQTQKLLPEGPGYPRSFGLSVALENSVAAIGCGGILNNGLQNRGAAFMFHESGGTFSYVQRLTSDVPSSFDGFGAKVVLEQGQLFATCAGYDLPMLNAGAVFIFDWNGSAWITADRLQSPDQAIGGFASSLDVQGDVAVFGVPGAVQGIAYVFTRSQGTWQHQQTLLPLGVGGADFGAAVDIRDEWLLIGAPEERFSFSTPAFDYAGSAYRFKYQDNAWALDRRMNLYWPNNYHLYGPVECLSMGPQPQNAYSQHAAYLARAVAITDGGMLASSERRVAKCWDSQPSSERHVVNVFSFDQPIDDCNLNSIADHCDDPDCNNNDIPDQCDLESQISLDCDGNLVPDECEAEPAYRLDTGTMSTAWSVNVTNGNADFIWLNEYRVKPGGQFITHVVLAKTPFLPKGAPVKVLIYRDPNNDGDPSDAMLMTTAETTSMLVPGDRLQFTTIPVSPTYVGEPGDYFFVGGVVQPPFLIPSQGYNWAAPLTSTDQPSIKRSWRALAPPGMADIHDLTNNAAPIAHMNSSGPFRVRAIASDCNGNGAWDACDIASGTSADLNSNGIPDECETTACVLADLAPSGGDGEVNMLDLLEVVIHWGECAPCFAVCPGDVNDDCIINVTDLIYVLTMWGTCPAR